MDYDEILAQVKDLTGDEQGQLMQVLAEEIGFNLDPQPDQQPDPQLDLSDIRESIETLTKATEGMAEMKKQLDKMRLDIAAMAVAGPTITTPVPDPADIAVNALF